MKTYDFEMTFDGQTVATGTTSAVMLFEFQRAFAYGIAGKDNPETNEFEVGGFYLLDEILDTGVDVVGMWRSDARTGVHAFRYTRIN